jgi:hypothetical protein
MLANVAADPPHTNGSAALANPFFSGILFFYWITLWSILYCLEWSRWVAGGSVVILMVDEECQKTNARFLDSPLAVGIFSEKNSWSVMLDINVIRSFHMSNIELKVVNTYYGCTIRVKKKKDTHTTCRNIPDT